MALFQDRPVRATVSVIVVLFVAHVVSLFVSHFHAFHLTQTSVAILAVSGLIFLITMHHRREGHLLTQTQEEMVLIFCFGLFWMSVLLGWHSLKAQGQGANSWLAAGGGADDATMPVVDVRTRRMEGIAGQGQGVRPYPCAIDDAYCIVEEYTFF
ncbi:hypothetical protein DFH08DRAFT_831077 [Mycena albidolilacea]|uniref:Uncharacterized protein n=1 Tax=Mycena albidolilacea TaxID=1033008 RepID=A0AAD7F475_9AGAR|nr:hypothetical protein DFH08DRAFT_831077 [Mycena albidolilacea]